MNYLFDFYSSKNNILLDGHCDKNYEPVKKHVEKMLQDGIEENLQLCVYVDDKCVVDLYGTAVGDSTYNCDTISVSNSGYNGKLDRIQSYNTILLALITAQWGGYVVIAPS